VSLDLAPYDARWLKAWIDKEVLAPLSFHAFDVIYKDPLFPWLARPSTIRSLGDEPVCGNSYNAVRPQPNMVDSKWFCGRSIRTIDVDNGVQAYLRGFDPAVLKGEQISLHEAYHPDANLGLGDLCREPCRGMRT
jgi:hypothetical protein